MTTPSPTDVKYEYLADYRTPDGWKPLPVRTIEPSADKDRVPYTSAALTIAPIDEATLALLDPRKLNPAAGGQVRWRITQFDTAGNVLGWLPRVGTTPDDYAIMHVRTLNRRLDEVSLDLQGRETLLDDRLHLSSGPTLLRALDKPSASLRVQAESMLERAIGTGVIDGATPEIIDIIDEIVVFPWMAEVNPGESYFSALETELASRDLRVIDLWGNAWIIAGRDKPPTYPDAPDIVKLAAYDDDNRPADADPIITDLDEQFTRSGDWADAIYIQGSQVVDGYIDRWMITATPGTYTKGRVIDIGTQAPTDNLAARIAARANRKGRDLTIRARSRFDVLPGMTLEVHLLEVTLTAEIASVRWGMNGEMTIHAESALDERDLASENWSDRNEKTPDRVLSEAQAYARSLQPKTDVLAEVWEQAKWAGGVL